MTCPKPRRPMSTNLSAWDREQAASRYASSDSTPASPPLDRCAFGWSRFGSFSTAVATPFVDPVWVFLERPVSLRKP
jgi:hypothetical protein